MDKNKKESFFWTSYSDLMTSLFFVMLVLFILVIVLLHNKISDQALKLEEFEKIEEIKKSLNNIDSTYFFYNPAYKKHILNIHVNFPTGESRMDYIDCNVRHQLEKAGRAVKNQIDKITHTNPEIQYLLIIEGQSSRDDYAQNYELSYERALALSRFWQNSDIDFGRNCEVLISGSGTGGSMRDSCERNNQRFLIHIIPKTGEIEQKHK
jgi:hypothetical protein